MENQEKMSYYIPTIEELHVSYQCEITYAKDLIGTRDEYFFKYIVEPQYFNEGDYVAVRTPFLTKEQIEAEGWKNTGRTLISSSEQYYEKGTPYKIGHSFLSYIPYNHRMKISIFKGNFDNSGTPKSDIVFEGEIQSINEFKTLMKWLHIQ